MKLIGLKSFVFFLVVFFSGRQVLAQGCLGTTGLGPSGGVTKTSNGFACANIDALRGPGSGAVIDITAGDVVDGDNVEFIIIWDDGSPSPILPAVKVGPNNWQLLNQRHYFPT